MTTYQNSLSKLNIKDINVHMTGQTSKEFNIELESFFSKYNLRLVSSGFSYGNPDNEYEFTFEILS